MRHISVPVYPIYYVKLSKYTEPILSRRATKMKIKYQIYKAQRVPTGLSASIVDPGQILSSVWPPPMLGIWTPVSRASVKLQYV